jgi:hypothetical protein
VPFAGGTPVAGRRAMPTGGLEYIAIQIRFFL